MGRPRRPRLTSYAAAIVVLGAVVYPCWWPHGDDSFPLSNYPMFAKPRAQQVRVQTVVGVNGDGTRETLSPELIGGTRWINMAARLVRQTVRKRGSAPSELCRTVADRVSQQGPPNVEGIEVVTEVFDSVAHVTETAPPIRRRVHARCRVDE